ncbi:hypothetical protein Hanom_Chr08g00719571 [Helianthus anomalus]
MNVLQLIPLGRGDCSLGFWLSSSAYLILPNKKKTITKRTWVEFTTKKIKKK